MDKLADWPDILLGFKNVMTHVQVPDKNRLCDDSRNATFRLLRFLSRNEGSKNYAKIEGNFLIAALHIACMKELGVTAESFPDIPENLEFSFDK